MKIINDNIEKNLLRNSVRLSLRRKKLVVNQIFLLKLWYIGQIYITPKYIKKNIEERTKDLF